MPFTLTLTVPAGGVKVADRAVQSVLPPTAAPTSALLSVAPRLSSHSTWSLAYLAEGMVTVLIQPLMLTGEPGIIGTTWLALAWLGLPRSFRDLAPRYVGVVTTDA